MLFAPLVVSAQFFNSPSEFTSSKNPAQKTGNKMNRASSEDKNFEDLIAKNKLAGGAGEINTI
jgi:hypothetical protein